MQFFLSLPSALLILHFCIHKHLFNSALITSPPSWHQTRKTITWAHSRLLLWVTDTPLRAMQHVHGQLPPTQLRSWSFAGFHVDVVYKLVVRIQLITFWLLSEHSSSLHTPLLRTINRYFFTLALMVLQPRTSKIICRRFESAFLRWKPNTETGQKSHLFSSPLLFFERAMHAIQW